MSLIKNLFKWYYQNKRELPWRATKNPYFIWISEIILQQTRVIQGYSYYNRFIETFPDIQSLASAEQQDVLKIWQGLGYYSRARNIHFAAKQIVNEYNGIFPNEFEKIINLKGIGEYSAGAIASLAFKLPYPAIDGNVQRVIARLYGISKPINSSKGKKEIYNIVYKLIDKNNPDIFNQSLIELGALVCKPKNPECITCPLIEYCFAFKNQIQFELPLKIKLKKPKDRYFYYFVFQLNENNQKFIYINKRLEDDIWKNLFDFPIYESKSASNLNDEILSKVTQISGHSDFIIKKIGNPIKHQLTHQTIYAYFIDIELLNIIKITAAFEKIPINKLSQFPFPKLIESYILENIIPKNIF